MNKNNICTVCIAIMGYNSADDIREKLKDITRISDEFIYIDQYSTDDTVTLISPYLREQDRLVQVERSLLLNEGFAAVRNKVFDYAKSDWILFLDTDEYVNPDNFINFKEYLNTCESNIVGLTRCNFPTKFDTFINSKLSFNEWFYKNVTQNTTIHQETQLRCCRRIPSIKWEGLIHEELWEDNIAGAFKYKLADNFPLLHFASKSDENTSNKQGLYSWLLLKSCMNDLGKGTNPFWYRHLLEGLDYNYNFARQFAQDNGLNGADISFKLFSIKSVHEIFQKGYFSHDWFSANVNALEEIFTHHLGNSAGPLKMLEIGSFEGLSTCYFLNNLLAHPESRLTCIDPFTGSIEHSQLDLSTLYTRFIANIVNTCAFHKVSIMQGFSNNILPELLVKKEKYDVIYVDGSHTAFDVLSDAVMSFYLLKVGGIMIFDDYLWPGSPDISYVPKAGVDAFVNVFYTKIQVIPNSRSYQLQIKKLKE
jgi:glycosyltransferase involved in cell wall biosynthesis